MSGRLLAGIGLALVLAVIAAALLLDVEGERADESSSPGVVGARAAGSDRTTALDALELQPSSAVEERRLDVIEAPGGERAISPSDDLVAAEEARLVGRVTRAGSGEAAAGLVLVPRWRVAEADGSSSLESSSMSSATSGATRREPEQTTTDEQGRYEFVVGGAATVESMEILPSGDLPRQRIQLGVVLVLGAETVASFEVTGGVQITGHVVDLEGAPVPGATVRGWTGNLYLLTPERLLVPDQSVVCDDNGAFSLGGVGPAWVLAAAADGLAAHQRVHGRQTPGSSVAGVTLVLSAARQISGRVLGAGARPLPGASIKATVTLRGASQTLTGIESTYIVGPPAVSATSDEQGRFTLAPLASRSYTVSVQHPRYPQWTGEQGVGDGELLVQLEPGLTLGGQILSAAGEPVLKALVELDSTGFLGGARRSARTDAHGRFLLEGLVADSGALLLCQAAGFSIHVEQPVVIREGGQPELTIVLSPALGLAGRVTDPAGHPLAHASVAIEGDRLIDYGEMTVSPLPTWEQNFGLSSTETDSRGRFAIEGLYDGLFRVEASSENGDLRAVVVARSGNENLELVLDPDAIVGVVLLGRAYDVTTGLPLSSFDVTPMIPSSHGGMSGTSQHFESEQGDWRIVGLEAGPMMLTAQAAGYAPWSAELVDYVEGEQRIEIAFWPTRSVVFSVLDEQRQPLQVELTFADEQGRKLMVETGPATRSSRLKTDEQGRGRATGLPAGMITVTIKRGWFSKEQDHTVDLTQQPSGPIELIYGSGDQQTVMLMVLTGTPSDSAVLEIHDLTDVTAVGALQRELQSGALRPLDVPVLIEVVDDEGKIVAGRTLAPGGGALPGGAGARLPESSMLPISLPRRALRVSVSAPGYIPWSRSWIPEDDAGARLLLLVLREQ